jgi:hypothetical protein
MSPVQDTDTHEPDFKLQVASMRSLIDAPSPADDKTEELKAELTQRADELARATDWTRDQFLEHAGCSSEQLVIDGNAKIDFMLACLSYLLWMEGFLTNLDLVFDRQTAVIASTRLFHDGGRDLDDCKRAMTEKLSPAERSAEELISFGEVTKGFQVALAHTDSKPGRAIKRVLLDDPCYLSSPHVSDDRVHLAWTDPEALGVRVAESVRRHVGECSVCAASRTRTPA